MSAAPAILARRRSVGSKEIGDAMSVTDGISPPPERDRAEAKVIAGAVQDEDSIAPLTPELSLQISCTRNLRYHEDRERFLDRAHKVLILIIVSGGSSALTPLISIYPLNIAVPVTIMAAGIFDIILNFSKQIATHQIFRQRTLDLLIDIGTNSENFETLQSKADQIFNSAPPTMHAVNAIAYNNALRGLGRRRTSELYIGIYPRIFKHVFPFANTDFDRRRVIEKKKLLWPRGIYYILLLRLWIFGQA